MLVKLNVNLGFLKISIMNKKFITRRNGKRSEMELFIHQAIQFHFSK